LILPLFTLPSNIKQLAVNSAFFVHCLLDILPALTEITELELDGQSGLPTVSETTIIELTSREDRLPVKTILGDGIALWISLLPLTSRMVKSITLGYSGFMETTPAEIRRLFEVIGQSCPCLRELIFRQVDLEAEPEDLQGIFVPLLQCVHMEALGIDRSSFDFSYTLVDAEIDTMARVWKHLRRLSLNCNAEEREEWPPLTLHTVASLKRNCAQLSDLDLTVDAISEFIPSRLPPTNVLVCIGFGFSRIDDAASLAFWLQPICEMISWEGTADGDETLKLFNDLDNFLRLLHSSASKLSLSKDVMIKSLREENMRLKERLREMEAETGR
jgi:hypothetical protein